jgi:hypothetical protein
MAPVPGLCKVVPTTEIGKADWSLTPGRYVVLLTQVVDMAGAWKLSLFA